MKTAFILLRARWLVPLDGNGATKQVRPPAIISWEDTCGSVQSRLGNQVCCVLPNPRVKAFTWSAQLSCSQHDQNPHRHRHRHEPAGTTRRNAMAENAASGGAGWVAANVNRTRVHDALPCPVAQPTCSDDGQYVLLGPPHVLSCWRPSCV